MNNNTQTIMDLNAKIEDLDMRTKSSVLMSWMYATNSAAINAAMFLLPDDVSDAVGEGVDGYGEYEAATRHALNEINREEGDFQSSLPSLVALHHFLRSEIAECDGLISEFQDTLEFKQSLIPRIGDADREYASRVARGQRPGVSRKDFVKMQHDIAVKSHNRVIKKGTFAVQLIAAIPITDGFENVPSWLPEAFEDKLIQKLKDRWTRLELDRTGNGRASKIDEAQANQMLIEHVLTQFGENIGYQPTEEDDKPIADPVPMDPTMNDPLPE